MTENPTKPVAADTTRPLFWRRWRGRIGLSLLFFLGISAYYLHTHGQLAGLVLLPDTGPEGPNKLFIYLPGLGDLDSFREDQSPARVISKRLGLPQFPDITGIDEDGQKQFYNMFLQLRDEPKNHDKYGLLGQLYEAQKFPELAIQAYQRAIAAAPDDYEWHYALALRLAADGEEQHATDAFLKASQLEPTYAPVWIRLAEMAEARQEYQEGLELVEKYVQLRPTDPFGYIRRARFHDHLGQPDRVMADIEKASALGTHAGQPGPIGPQGHRMLAKVYHDLGREQDRTFHSLMAADSRQPTPTMDDPIALMVERLATYRKPLLAKLNRLVGLGDWQEAVALTDDIVAQHKNDHDFASACGQLAECYRHLGQFDKAIEFAEKACELAPQLPRSYAALALAHFDAGNLSDALVEANKSLAIDPNLDVALYVRGLTLKQLALAESRLPPGLRSEDPVQRVEQAVSDLDRCVEQKPVNFDYLLNAGSAHGLLGHYDRAIDLLDTALRIRPHHSRAVLLRRMAAEGESFWPADATVE